MHGDPPPQIPWGAAKVRDRARVRQDLERGESRRTAGRPAGGREEVEVRGGADEREVFSHSVPDLNL